MTVYLLLGDEVRNGMIQGCKQLGTFTELWEARRAVAQLPRLQDLYYRDVKIVMLEGDPVELK